MKTARSDGSLKPQTKMTVMLAVVIALVLGATAGLESFTFVSSTTSTPPCIRLRQR